MTPTEPMRSVVSASSMARRKACPGSAWAEKGLPRLDNPYSEEGTLLHKHDAYPDLDRSGLSVQHREILKRNAFLRQQFLDRELPRLGIPPDAKRVEMVEKEFLLLNDDEDPVISHGQQVPGHPDRVLWFPDYLVAIIFDSKFGRIPVEAAWLNEQLKFYFVVLCDQFVALSGRPPETVIVAITQPWAPKGNDFHSAEYSGKDSFDRKQEILEIIHGAEPANAERHASVAACTYCTACAQCPVAVNALTEFAVQKVAELTPAQLEMLWDDVLLARKVDEHWVKRMRYLAENAPELVPNTELKSTGNTRSADALSAFRRLSENGALAGTPVQQAEQFIGLFCKFSVSDLEDFLFQSKNLTRPAAEAQTKDLLGDLLKDNPKAKSLVRKVASVHNLKAA